MNERSLINVSLLVLALVTLFVYTVFFNVRGTSALLVDGLSGSTLTGTQSDFSGDSIVFSGDNKNFIEKLKQTSDIDSGVTNSGDNYKGSLQNLPASEKGSVNQLFGSVTERDSSIPVLKGTSVIGGGQPLFEKLSITPEQILKDSRQIIYGYLGSTEYDRKKIVKKVGGNTVEINTEKDILSNKLFGEKIIFVNLPEYKNAYVIIILFYKKSQRIIQLPYGIYHNSKGYLREIFSY